MSLTNGQLRPPWMCSHASVAWSTMGHHLLPSAPSHKNCVMLFSNRDSARVGAGAAESTWSTVGRIMVHNECEVVDGQVPLAPCFESCQCFGKCILPWCHIWVAQDDGTQVTCLVLWSQNCARNHIWWWWVLRHAATQE